MNSSCDFQILEEHVESGDEEGEQYGSSSGMVTNSDDDFQGWMEKLDQKCETRQGLETNRKLLLKVLCYPFPHSRRPC